MVKSDKFQSLIGIKLIAIKLIGLASDMDVMVNRGFKITFSSEQISVW